MGPRSTRTGLFGPRRSLGRSVNRPIGPGIFRASLSPSPFTFYLAFTSPFGHTFRFYSLLRALFGSAYHFLLAPLSQSYELNLVYSFYLNTETKQLPSVRTGSQFFFTFTSHFPELDIPFPSQFSSLSSHFTSHLSIKVSYFLPFIYTRRFPFYRPKVHFILHHGYRQEDT